MIRVPGPIARCIYGATVAFGDRLTIDPLTSRLVPFDTDAGDGHTHNGANVIARRVVMLTDYGDNPITGADTGTPGVDTGDFAVTVQWDDAGSLNPTSDIVTITEIGSGQYFLAFTPLNAHAMYLLTVQYTASGIKGVCRPDQFQFDAQLALTTPRGLSLKMVVGRALKDGGDGDEGLVLLQPQFF